MAKVQYKYNEDYLTSLKIIFERSRSEYYILREVIEEEIIKRQTKWRVSTSSPPVQKETGKETAGGRVKPPPGSSPVYGNTQIPPAPATSSFSHQPAAKTQEPVEPKAADNSGETGLIYRSDFYSSSDNWLEGEKDGIKRFCQEGYYHILLVNPCWWANSTLDNINLTDFRVYAEAEIIMHTGNNARCGIVFRRTNTENEYSFYYLSISRSGYYNIGVRNSKYRRDILVDRYSEFINQGDSVNSLMVEAIGQKMTIGVNGHILETVMDNSLTSGSIGFWLQTGLDSTAEARFCNFRLYSLER